MPQGGPLSLQRLLSIASMPAGLRLFLGAASGALLSFSFTGHYISLYSWFSVAILIYAAIEARPAAAFFCGFLHACAFVFLSVPWFATVLTVHGGISEAGGWGLLLLIAIAWGVLIGTFSWIVQRLSSRSIGIACLGAPFLWISFEFVRTHLPEIGFPWNLLGYPAATNSGLVQLTTVTGIYGLSFVVAGYNAMFVWMAAMARPSLRSRLIIGIVFTGVLAAVLGAGVRYVPIPKANHVARAVQLNFPEVPAYPSDWFRVHASDLESIERLSLGPAAQPPDLLVWPETPAPFSQQDPQFAKIASSVATKFGHSFLAGSIEWKTPVNPTENGNHPRLVPYNSALLFDPQGQRVFVYDKIHLVPFGEYEPFPLIHRVVTSVSDEVGGFHKGNRYAVGKLSDGNHFGVFICYEAIFPNEVRRFPAGGAQVLVNISNDGWFGRSAAPEQHLRMLRVRAVENRRWIVRSTNNGYTVSIDPYGKIYAPLPPDVRAAADLPYDFRSDETIYTRFGDWFAWLCVLVSVILLATTFRKVNLELTPSAS
jgi:apolipoprotein N-acyltransferase